MKLSLSLVAAVIVAASIEPPVQQNDPASVVQGGWKEVSEWILKSAELVPADKYAYKPVGTVRTFGQQVAHVADAYNWYCGSAKAGKDVEWSDAVEKAGGDKAAIIAKLKTAMGVCASVYATPEAAAARRLIGNIAHSNLHYGNMVTYIRMLGLVPPSS